MDFSHFLGVDLPSRDAYYCEKTLVKSINQIKNIIYDSSITVNEFPMLLPGSLNSLKGSLWSQLHFYKVTQSWHFLCVHSGTCWSQTYQPLWPLGSCVRRWEQCAALPSSSPSHSSGLMMKVDSKILHHSLCALSCMLWPFHTNCLTLAHFQGFWPIKNSSLRHHTSHWNYMVHCEHWHSQNIVITLPQLLSEQLWMETWCFGLSVQLSYSCKCHISGASRE